LCDDDNDEDDGALWGSMVSTLEEESKPSLSTSDIRGQTEKQTKRTAHTEGTHNTVR
jgi:hypothetical protein